MCVLTTSNAARCVITYPASLVASCVNTNAGMCTRVYKQLLSALTSACLNAQLVFCSH